MERNRIFKPEQEILKQLGSINEQDNLLAVEKLRAAGKVGYLPSLIGLAKSTKHPSVFKAVFGLLDELKNKNAVPFLVEAIRDETNRPILKRLVESCWQNGLDYSGYLPVFTALLSHGTDEISFEAFTVIENLEFMPGGQVLKEEILHLEAHLEGAGETRKYFISEAIRILKNRYE